MRKLYLLLALIILMASSALFADYSDVLLVSNSNSTVSLQIAAYFAQQRNISHWINVTMAESEAIKFGELNSTLLQPVRAYLNSSNGTGINYIVLTKGIPLWTNETESFVTMNKNASSVDSELALVNTAYEQYAGQNNRIANPYYGSASRFSRAAYGIYLVTRLDGYNYTDVKNMIDGSASTSKADRDSGLHILVEYSVWNYQFYLSNQTLASAGLNVFYNSTQGSYPTYPPNMQNVSYFDTFGCYNFGGCDSSYWGNPNYTWKNGSFASARYSFSARTTNYPHTQYADYTTSSSQIADYIHEGANGGLGYSVEPWSSGVANPQPIAQNYLANLPLADMLWSGVPHLSWGAVVFGDPKTSYPSANVSILPAAPTPQSNLTCYLNITDSMGARQYYNVTYEWYKNGVNQTSLGGSVENIPIGTQIGVSNISAGNLTASDNWLCAVSIFAMGTEFYASNASVSISAAPFACSNIISSGAYLLSANTSSSSTCFNVYANNVEINCNGSSITGGNATGSYGIYSNSTNTTIRNCIISNFQHGIYFNRSTGGSISNTSASTACHSGCGISLEYTNGSAVADSVGSASSASSAAVCLSSSDSNRFISNRFNAPLSVAAQFNSSSNNTFLQNNITALKWVFDNGTGNLYNNSSVGNIYYFANGTPAWASFDIYETDGSRWAQYGASLPFSQSVLSSAYWEGAGQDSRPYTLVSDILPPAINLVSPTNNSNSTPANFMFIFTVADDHFQNATCNLSIDSALNATNLATMNGTPYSLPAQPQLGGHNWSVSCIDGLGRSNSSPTLNFNIFNAVVSGNASSINASGITNISASINGSTAANGSAYDRTLQVNISNNGLPLVSFQYDFNASAMNFSAITIARGSISGKFYMETDGINATGGLVSGKTLIIYGANSSYNAVCIKDAEGALASSISAGCTGAGETQVLCDGISHGGYACTNQSGSNITITGLSHTALIQYQHVPPAPPAPSGSGGSSGGGGGGGGGGSSSSMKNTTMLRIALQNGSICGITITRTGASAENISKVVTVIKNTGICSLAGLAFRDTLPESFYALPNVSFSMRPASVSGHVLEFTFPSINPGESRVLEYSAAAWFPPSKTTEFSVYNFSFLVPRIMPMRTPAAEDPGLRELAINSLAAAEPFENDSERTRLALPMARLACSEGDYARCLSLLNGAFTLQKGSNSSVLPPARLLRQGTSDYPEQIVLYGAAALPAGTTFEIINFTHNGTMSYLVFSNGTIYAIFKNADLPMESQKEIESALAAYYSSLGYSAASISPYAEAHAAIKEIRDDYLPGLVACRTVLGTDRFVCKSFDTCQRACYSVTSFCLPVALGSGRDFISSIWRFEAGISELGAAYDSQDGAYASLQAGISDEKARSYLFSLERISRALSNSSENPLHDAYSYCYMPDYSMAEFTTIQSLAQEAYLSSAPFYGLSEDAAAISRATKEGISKLAASRHSAKPAAYPAARNPSQSDAPAQNKTVSASPAANPQGDFSVHLAAFAILVPSALAAFFLLSKRLGKKKAA